MNTENMKVPFPGWSVVREIGHGGYGKVYEIRRHLLDVDERSAMKVIPVPRDPAEIRDYLNDGYDPDSLQKRYENSRNAVLREYTMMARMKDCVNIVRCEDITVVMNPDRISSRIFIRMELLTPMREYEKLRIFDENEVIRLGLDMCSILSVCEREGVVHRDIKPANIMVSPGGDYKLGDFGIARMMDHTTAGTRIGTVNYMAPEVYFGGRYGHTADIYSLGLVLYWLMNNRRIPFLPPADKGGNINDELEAQQKRLGGLPVPRPCSGSSRLAEVILRALAYKPQYRFQTAEEFKEALRLCVKNPGEKTAAYGDGLLSEGDRTDVYGRQRTDTLYGAGNTAREFIQRNSAGNTAGGLNRRNPEEETFSYGDAHQPRFAGQTSSTGQYNPYDSSSGNSPGGSNDPRKSTRDDLRRQTGPVEPKKKSTRGRIVPFLLGMIGVLAAMGLIFYIHHRAVSPDDTDTSSKTSGENAVTAVPTESAVTPKVAATPAPADSPSVPETPAAESSASEPEPVTVHTQYGVIEYGSDLLPIKNEVNIRSEPTHDSNLLLTFDPVPHGDSSGMIFKGQTAEGYGSDNILHTWYLVGTTGDVQAVGWVRSDLVRLPAFDNGPWHIYYDGNAGDRKICVLYDPQGGLNVRSESKHESGLVDTIYGGTKLYFYDEVGQGYGSDGLLHDWYRVEWAVPGTTEEKAGWIRSDLVTVQYE